MSCMHINIVKLLFALPSSFFSNSQGTEAKGTFPASLCDQPCDRVAETGEQGWG